MKKLLVIVTLSSVAVLGLAASAQFADATPPANENNITLCHATAAVQIPYVVITVDTSGTGGQQQIFGPQGHASHTGAIFDPATNVNGDNWGDIIPPFPDPDGAGPFQGFAGLNWAEGQEINEAGCVVTVTTTVTTPPPPPPPTSTTPPPSTTTPPVTTTTATTTTPPPATTPPPGGGGGNPPPNQGPPNNQPPPDLAFTGFEVQPWMWIVAALLLLLGSTMLMRGYSLRKDEE
jgi:hypothetical protein